MALLSDDDVFGAPSSGGLMSDDDVFGAGSAKPKKNSALRGIADLGLGFAGGAVGATKALADAAGAGNGVSEVLDSANKGISGYLSDSAKADQQQQAAITKEAEGKGTWEGIKAGAKAFGVAPAQTAVSGLGSVVPVLAATTATALTGGSAPAMLAAGAATGAAMGAGTVKGAIYDEVKKRGIDSGMTESDASAAAEKSQAYGGENSGNIALGAGLGVADAATGVTKAASGMIRDAIIKPAAKEVAAEAATQGANGLLRRTAAGMAGEMPLEAAQGGQEKYAANVAARRAGYDVDAWDGVASQATLEALASAGPGGLFGAVSGAKYAESKKPEIAGLLPAPTYTGTPGGQLVTNDAARQAEIDAADANAAAVYAARDAFEKQLRQSVTIINEPAPLQQRIDEMLRVDTEQLTGIQRSNYEKKLADAFGEQIGIRHDANQREVPFTMGEYLDAQVHAEDAVRSLPMKKNAALQSDSRMQQLAEEESTAQADIPPSPVIPVVGPLSAAANVAVQTGAHANTIMQQTAAMAQQQAGIPNGDGITADPPAPNNGAQAPNIAQPAPNTQPQGEGGTPATAQQAGSAATSPAGVQATTSNFDVSNRTDTQLNYLTQHGQPGWKEAAVAELQKRGVQVSEAPAANSATQQTMPKEKQGAHFESKAFADALQGISLPQGLSVSAERNSYDGGFTGRLNIMQGQTKVGHVDFNFNHETGEVTINKSELADALRGKGIAKSVYSQINQTLRTNGLPVLGSDPKNLTQHAVNLWKSLVRDGVASERSDGRNGYQFNDGQQSKPSTVTDVTPTNEGDTQQATEPKTETPEPASDIQRDRNGYAKVGGYYVTPYEDKFVVRESSGTIHRVDGKQVGFASEQEAIDYAKGVSSKPAPKAPTEGGPEDSIGWTSMTTVQREGLLHRAGYSTKDMKLNIGGKGLLNRAWENMGKGAREKLIAAHESRYSQPEQAKDQEPAKDDHDKAMEKLAAAWASDNAEAEKEAQATAKNEQADNQSEQPLEKVKGYEQRNADRVSRVNNANTQVEFDAITAEEHADSERHFEGTERVSSAINDRKFYLKIEARKAEAESRYNSGDWIVVSEHGSRSAAEQEAESLQRGDKSSEYSLSIGQNDGWSVRKRKVNEAKQDQAPALKSGEYVEIENSQGGKISGAVISALDTSGGNVRYDIRTGTAPDGYPAETRIYSQNIAKVLVQREATPDEINGKFGNDPKPTGAELLKARIEADKEKAGDTDARFANNKIFTADKVAAARARLKSKLGTMNSGIDPELLVDGMTIAGAYIEGNIRKFGDYAKAMVADLGEGVKPYLLSFYEAARAYPGLNKLGMDSQEEAAKQHQALLTPEVRAAAKDVVGESPKVEKKKPANLGEAVRLKADWGVRNIDGYTKSKTGKNQETDYGLKGGIKDEFLADAKRYLSAVAKALEAKGYTVKADRKGKPGKAVSVNEAGPAVSGDVYLRMSNGEFDVFAQVGETAVRGMGPEHPQGVSLMVRAGPSSDNFSPNNWMDTSLSAGDLVSWFEKRRQAYEQRGATQPVKEPEANEPPDLTTEAGKFTVAKEIADYLIGGDGFKTIIEARKKISSIIGKPIEAATELAKQADEAIETAVVMAGREIVKAGRAQNRSNVVIYDRLVDLYRRQPNLAVRSSTSVRDQAYSTPVPLAYLASELAGITYETSVYEPTAGNGMLLVGAAADNVVANELNPKRAAMIRALMPEANVRENNGAEWRPDAKVDAVIANPPFGAVKDGNGETVYFSITPEYDTRELDHAIVFKALESLKDNGRAVLIVGGVQSEAEEARREDYRGKNKRQFYFNLYNNFNVIDHFTADGDLYSKQGASYPVDVIVINGRGKSNRDLPAADLPKIIKSYEELKEKLNVANRMEPAGSDTARTGRSNDQGRGGDAQGLAGSSVGSSQQNGDGSRQRSDSAGVSNAGRSDNEQSAGGRPVSSGGQLESSGTSDGGNGNRVSDKGRAGRSDAGRNAQGNRSNDLGGTSVVDGQRVESGLTDRRGQEQETGHQVSYSPHSNAPAVGTLVPRAMRDAIASSLSKISDQVGDIDNYVAESLDMDPETVRSNFSAEQIDALALSIRNAEAGKGFIIGDQTGIGKGRVVAAMIRYALVNGKTPIFVTEKPNLYSDMIRDLDDIGMTDELGLDTKSPRILITNGGESIPYTLLRNVNGEVVENNLTLRAPKAGKALDDLMQSMVNGDDLGDYKVIFTTYSQLQTVKGKQTTRQRFVNHFGASNYMIFDESHNAGGAGETQARTKEQRQAAKDGQSLVTGRAAFVRGLVQKAFGTFFSSATYAKRPDVMDLYSSTNMKLAVDRISQLGDAIKSGGVPMQQVVANMLTQDGQYIRRERTFAGVDYNTKETVVDQQTAENMASAMRSILAFSRAKEGVIKQMQKEFDKQGAMLAAVGGESTSVQGANFGSIMHNLIDQMLLSLKAKSSVDHAIERLKAGEKVVMTVSNTMGSFLKDYADEFGVMAGDPVALSFSDLYVRYLEKQRIVSIKSGSGEKRQRRLTDAELGPTLVDLFNKVRKQIDESGFGSAPISPIDYMHAELRKAGYKTDEITGRTITLNYQGETPVLASRSANIKQRVGAVSSFNNGDTDVLILNQAGSTGLSLHASSKFKDKRKRHMIIVQAEKNIDTHMQMLGRVHRTGQVIAPAYSQMMADIPAEMRPASVLLKKMASLNANTTASRKSSVTAEGVVDFMNDYGGQVVHEYLRDNPDVLEAVGGPDVMKLTEDSEDGNEDDIRKFTGYVPILPIKMQEEIYRDLIDRYNDLIERENSLGTNKLEAKAVDLDAETLSAQPITEKKEEQSVFASPAVMEKVDVKRSVKPYSSEEVAAIVKERLGDKTARAIASEQKLELRDKASAFARERIAKMQADGADPIKVDMHKSQLNLIYSHTNSILDTYSIGDPVSIKDQNGQFLYGVVTDIQTNGKTANPAAGSSWKMTFAIANGDAKSITMNFSQLGSKYEVRAANIVDWYNIETQSAERVPLMSLFDKGATVRREKRWIITGNLLAGYSRLPGQIITYTKKDGTSAQGILMSRQFDFEKEMKNAPVLVKSGAEAVKLFNGIGNGASLGTKDRALMITDRNGRYELTVPSSKKDGGTYFLDQGITDIVGDLYKRGSIMSANVYGEDMLGRLVNYLINDRQEVIVALAHPEKAKQILRGEQGPGNIAERQASLSAADKAIYGMVAEGKNTADILKFIASASRSPMNRQIAKLLLKTGIAPQVMAGNSDGWKFNAGNDKKYAAAYNPNTDTISLFRPAAAERNFLHEAMHAATLRALGKKGMAAAQMRALFNHVKKSGKLKGMYGMSDVDEFIAEAFSNPKFQAMLKQVSAAPVGGKPSSAWDWFIRVVRGILGLKQGQDNALSQALEIGLGVMREDMKLRQQGGKIGDARQVIPATVITGQEIERTIGRTIQEKATNWMRANLQGKSNSSTPPPAVLKKLGQAGMTKLVSSTDMMGYSLTRDEAKEAYGATITYLKNSGIQEVDFYHVTDADLDSFKGVGILGSSLDYIGRADGNLRPSSVYGFLDPIDIEKGNDGILGSTKEMPNVAHVKIPVNEIIGLRWDSNFNLSYGTYSAVRLEGSVKPEWIQSVKPYSNTNEPTASAGSDAIRYNVADEGWDVSEPSKMDDVIYALQDKHIDMKRVVQAIMGAGKKIRDSFNPYLQEELFHGRAAKGVKDFLDFELRPLLKEMQQGNIDMGDFEEYLWNAHAQERNEQIAKVNPEMKDGGSGIKTADAKAYLAALSPELRGKYQALAARVNAINKASQKALVDSGLEKQETIDAWNGAYQHYVPLQREDVDSGHVGTGKGFSVRGSASKRAMGSGKKVVDIIANIAMQRERNIVRAEKNRVSNALMGLAMENPNPDFWKVDQAPKERVVNNVAIYNVLDSDGNKVADFTNMDEADRMARRLGGEVEQTWGDRVQERIEPGFKNRDNVLLTRVNGDDHYIIFNERDERAMRMATAMKNLDVDNLGRVLSVVGKATRYLSSINTQYNPVFGVINLIRDAQGALINLSSTALAGEQKRVLGYTKDALVGIYRDIRAHRAGNVPSSNWAALFEEFQKEGGQTGYRDQYANAEARAESIKSELEQFKEGKAKQLTRGLFGWLSDYNETMENAVRLAAYKAAKEKGLSKQQAASLAKNITVNFNRKGQMATQIGALYAFFNASVQGTARIAETLLEVKDGDWKTARLSPTGKKILVGGIMLGSMQALLLAAAGYGDDEPPEFVRERNLVLPIGDGKYLTLAMPLGFHVIPGIGRVATEFLLSGGKDPGKKLGSFFAMFADAFNPVGNSGWSLQTITPSVVDPFAALSENRDFTGKEIYRENFNKLNPTPGHARAKDVATAWSRVISEALNTITGGSEYRPGLVSWSPDAIDYLIGQATGGVGREVSKMSQTLRSASTGEDLPIYKVPLVGRFVGDTEGQSGQSQKFYDALRYINMHEAEYKGLMKEGRRDDARAYMEENPATRLMLAGSHAENTVRKLRAMKRDLVEGDNDPDKVREIDDRISQAMRSFNERYASLAT